MGDIQYVCKSKHIETSAPRDRHPISPQGCYTLEGLSSRSLYSLQSLEHFKHIDMVIRMTQCNRAWLQLFKYCLKFAYFRPHHQGLHPQHFVIMGKDEGRKVNMA